MNKMRKVIQDVLKMPYYKNYSAVSGAIHNTSNHEDAVEDILLKHKLIRVEMPAWSKPTGEVYRNDGKNHKPGDLKMRPVRKEERRNTWMEGKDTDHMPDNSYISQPCGTHDSPDFIVKVEGKMHFIECKSGTGPTPVYNSAYPKKQYIYIFCCAKYDETTVYLGGDIVTEDTSKLYEEMKAEISLIENKYFPLLKESDVNSRGLGYYNREMYIQEGGKEKTDYFKHSQREKCEKRVMELVS